MKVIKLLFALTVILPKAETYDILVNFSNLLHNFFLEIFYNRESLNLIEYVMDSSFNEITDLKEHLMG